MSIAYIRTVVKTTDGNHPKAGIVAGYNMLNVSCSVVAVIYHHCQLCI